MTRIIAQGYNRNMRKYSDEIYEQVRILRGQGYTYTEIQTRLHTVIPKGTLSYICKGVSLPPRARERIDQIIKDNSAAARQKAVIVNKIKHDAKVAHYRQENEHIAGMMADRNTQLIALAMLYLGEGAKWKHSRAPKLASSDPSIIRLYIDLLQLCYGVPTAAMRARVQHRADQNSAKLVKFWSSISGIPISRFYPCYIDRRTIGKKTVKSDYRGVCTIGCAGTHIQLELQQIADIIGTALRGISSFG